MIVVLFGLQLIKMWDNANFMPKQLEVALQLYSMGNQIKEGESTDNYFYDQIQILKWRADPQHNTHIARTVSLPAARVRSKTFYKVITAQLANKTFIDVANLAPFQRDKESSQREKQIMVFQHYVGSLVDMEDSLSMEEIIYVLITLLFGYEQIYKKMARACVHQSCCHLTAEGQVRAWIHSNHISCQMDIQLIKRKERQRIAEIGNNQKVLCKTQASICKRILSMAHRLSDKSESFMSFYRDVNSFIKENMLQNMNFIAIRTFVNGFIYRSRLIIKSNIIEAMKRMHRKGNQGYKSYKQIPNMCKSHNRVGSIEQFSLKSVKIELPIIQEQRPKSNIDHKISDIHLERHHDGPQICVKSVKKSLKRINQQIKTSQLSIPKEYDNCLSTKFQTPKTTSCVFDNQLSSSQLIVTRQLNKNSRLVRFNKIDNNDENLQKSDKYGEQDYKSKTVFLNPRNENNTIRLVRFHSHKPSFENYQAFNSAQLQQVVPEKQNDFCTHYSLSQTHNNLNDHNNYKHLDKQSRFATQVAFSQQQQSNGFNRVVSGLISNKQIDICESVGSFQSFKNSQNSSYSGVLLGMGRSVQTANSPSKRKQTGNYRNGLYRHMAPHMTY